MTPFQKLETVVYIVLGGAGRRRHGGGQRLLRERRSNVSGVRDDIWDWLESHGFTWENNRPCYKCRYWEPWEEDAQETLGMVGECHRYPPVPMSYVWDSDTNWRQPQVGCKATCGEWRKRKTK